MISDEDDLCTSLDSKDSSIVDSLKKRFEQKKIYTKVAEVMVAINPYEKFEELYSREVMNTYKNSNDEHLAPHVFSIGKKLIQSCQKSQSKTVILTGESGAGKSESAKQILKYICYSMESNDLIGRLKSLDPVLELFGNANTAHNRNSSRFNKFIQLYCFESNITAARVSIYSLEKSRILIQNSEGKHFHIFYTIFHQVSNTLKSKLYLDSLHAFANLSMNFESGMVGSYSFSELDTALSTFGICAVSRELIYKYVAAILHLGEIQFDDCNNYAHVSNSSESFLDNAAELLNIDKYQLKDAILLHHINATGEALHLTKENAIRARNSLARSIYKLVFDYIIDAFNGAITNVSLPFIGIMDITGFEYEDSHSSLEQFWINYVNERFQQSFVKKMLTVEEEWFKKDGLDVPNIPFFNNINVLNLFEGNNGLFSLLRDECSLAKPQAKNYIQNIYLHRKDDLSLESSHSKICKNEECFTVKHFARSVCYSTEQFIEKNNEKQSSGIVNLLNIITHNLGASPRVHKEKKGSSSLLITSLKKEMDILFGILLKSDTIFVRCLKPNHLAKPQNFDKDFVEKQLKCFGLAEYRDLMEKGFPYRFEFKQLLDAYGILKTSQEKLVRKIKQRRERFHLSVLLHSVGLDMKHFRLGNTRVCFRPLKANVLDKLLHPKEDEIALVKKTFEKKLVIIRRWSNLVEVVLKNASTVAKLEIETQLQAAAIDSIEEANHSKQPIKATRRAEKRPIKRETQHDSGPSYTKNMENKEESAVKRRRNERPERKRREVIKLPSKEIRFDRIDHYPAVNKNPSRNKCRLEGCTLKTNHFCIKCNVYLCIKEGKNCFLDFHTSP